ncbi:MAG: 5-formyltetrahydrofolate cyclo-ligase [Terrimicrobiaceae bacterium]|nr:5-formyltetrahydrofolate cyclo-ligase [Terrimicrobiaceae bacterium]
MIPEEKQRLRKAIRQNAASVGGNVRPALESWPIWQHAASVCAYWPLPGEPVWQDPWPDGKTVALPRVVGEHIDTFLVRDPEALVSGRFGILEPPPNAAACFEFDIILVPGLAFDRSGGRLGRGAGYYDRFLAKTPGLRVGVCSAVHPRIPMEEHDVRMDFVVTPDEVIDCRALS